MTAWLVAAVLSAAVATAPFPPEKPTPPRDQAVVSGVPSAPGMVCRDARLLGTRMPNIVEIGALACGINDPVEVTRIGRIQLSQPIVAGCRTARRIADWLTGSAQPAARATLGAGIVQAQIMGSYTCRRRNNTTTGNRSEHGLGRAVDIGGFTLIDGRRVSVADDWGKGRAGAFLHDIWQKGCGPFATVLGPDSDIHHHDHFHLDTSRRGGDAYCR